MSPNLLRLAYMLEFLVALVAVFEVWSQVGGQGHLDLMPWYTKLGLAFGLALVTVAGTVAAVSHERAWNAKTLACVALALLIAGGMAGVTYYYHVHENDDTDSADEGGSISRLSPSPAIPPDHPRGSASVANTVIARPGHARQGAGSCVRQNHDREGVAGPLDHARGSVSVADATMVRPGHDRQGAGSCVRQNHDREGVAGPLDHARGSVSVADATMVRPGHARQGAGSCVRQNPDREGVAGPLDHARGSVNVADATMVRPGHDRQGVGSCVRQNPDREGVAGPLDHARGSVSVADATMVRPGHARQGAVA